MKLLNKELFFLIVDFLRIKDIFKMNISNKYINFIIKNYNNYWNNFITLNKLDINPFYNYLYCHRFISLNNSNSDVNKVDILFKPNYEKINDKNSVSKSPLIFYNTINNLYFFVSISTKIKINGFYKIIWLISIDKNSFISNLHLITFKNKYDNSNINLINDNNQYSSKLIDNNHYQLSSVKTTDNLIYNYLNIQDQHNIRNKGWYKLSTDTIYLKENDNIVATIQNKNNIFCKYKIDGIYLIKTS